MIIDTSHIDQSKAFFIDFKKWHLSLHLLCETII
jgi:hypothetical protein